MSHVREAMRRGWILVPAVLVLSACGGTTHKAMGPPLRTVQVTEKEFSITPSTIALGSTGTYSFTVTNNGAITHAFEVQGHGVTAKTGNISPASSATLTVDLSAKGSYQAFCPIDGHRAKGMQASITVGAAPAAGGGATTTTTTTQTTTTVPTTTTSPPGY
jgi:plastocyanin